MGHRGPALYGPSEDYAAVWTRPLERLLAIGDAHLALVVRRRSDGRGVVRIAGVAASRADLRPLDRAALQMLAEVDEIRDAGDGDGHTAVFWLQGLPCAMALVLVRRADAPSFSQREFHQIDGSIRWIEDLAALWWQNRRAAARVEGLRAGFGLRGTGAILLDGRGTIIEVNDSAHGLLRRGAGLAREGDRIVATDPDDAQQLTQAITGVLVAGRVGRRVPPRHFALVTDNGRQRVHVAVMQPYYAPAMRGDLADPAALVLAVDPWAEPAKPAAADFYRFSPAQARLTARLVRGETLAEAAEALGLTHETARTYLKQVFDKTGARRQSTLVRTMLMGQVPERRSGSYAFDRTLPVTRVPIVIAGAGAALDEGPQHALQLKRAGTPQRTLHRPPRARRRGVPVTPP